MPGKYLDIQVYATVEEVDTAYFSVRVCLSTSGSENMELFNTDEAIAIGQV